MIARNGITCTAAKTLVTFGVCGRAGGPVTNEVITKVIGDSVRYAISSRLFAARAMTAQCMPSSCVRLSVCVCLSVWHKSEFY